MDKKNVIKKDLLRRKIQEYFTKHPSAKSVIVKADVGDTKTLWKVVREGVSFKILEVNTQKEEFVMEAPFGNASNPFVQLSVMTTQTGMDKLNSPQGRKQFAQQALPLISKMQGNEKTQARQLLGNLGFDEKELRSLLNLSPAGATPAPAAAKPGMQTSGKIVSGKIVKEDDDKPKKKDDEKDGKEKTKPKKKEPPKATDKLEPASSPEEEPGVETSVDAEEPIPDQAPTTMPSSEETAVSQNLAGQTIKAANLVLNPSGGKLSLDLTSAAVPAELEWTNTGKVVFHFNGRPYVVKRG